MKKEVIDYEYSCDICKTELGKGCGFGIVVHEDIGAEVMTKKEDVELCDIHLCADCTVAINNATWEA